MTAHSSRTSDDAFYLCPRCKRRSLTRMRRTFFDRLVSRFVRVKRFECQVCRWVGRIRADNRMPPP